MNELLYNKDYWKQVIHDIELKSHLKSRKKFIKNYDFSVTLPENLRNRVSKILPYEFGEFDKNVFHDETPVETPRSFGDDDSDEAERMKKEKKKKGLFNESTCSDIERMENEYNKFEVKMDHKAKKGKKSKKVHNWCSTFVCQPRKERVKWESKIYQMETNIWEKTLDEQAEQLMNASAERFTEWVNALGSNSESDITIDHLKALFSIEADRKVLAAIQTEPKEVKAIAKTVADKWNLPEMAIELKYEEYIDNLLKAVPKKVIRVAFGRTVPNKELPWIPTDRDSKIVTVYPDEILSGEKLFRGILHLRSVKSLVEFCRNHERVPKPQYLIQKGMFKHKEISATKQDIPLYELLKLKY